MRNKRSRAPEVQSDEQLSNSPDVPIEPLRMIDTALQEFTERRLVPATEVVDLLLDLRSAIARDLAFAAMFADDFVARGTRESCTAR